MEVSMGVILLVLLLALIFGGLGFALHWLWIIAVVFFLAWLAGFAFRSGSGSRWYRW
ncbi:MAG: hydrophobic protein [Acidothermus cellulolyticus]|jgi:phosphoglycerol transferase MdoB-like AlkP superfamily enzyme|nr:hydrophobic protein [Acidothermus cellulolyticus]